MTREITYIEVETSNYETFWIKFEGTHEELAYYVEHERFEKGNLCRTVSKVYEVDRKFFGLDYESGENVEVPASVVRS